MLSRLQNNYRILSDALESFAREFERRDYTALEQLLGPSSGPQDEPVFEKTFEEKRMLISVDLIDKYENGDIHIVLNIDGLPTLLGIKPSWQFYKRRDGSTYY